MAEYEISNEYEIPTDFRTTESRYPFENMEVGQSFFIIPEYEEETLKRLSNRIAQARQAFQKRKARMGEEVQFTQRLRTENDETGYRIWRVK